MECIQARGPGGDPNGGSSTGTNGGPGDVGSGGRVTREARLVARVQARPTVAMLENQTFGTVQLWVVVGPDGKIVSAVPQQSLPNGGTEAALQALYRCKFRPALKAGVPVTSERLLVRFEFRST
jgi:hypothetical protein